MHLFGKIFVGGSFWDYDNLYSGA